MPEDRVLVRARQMITDRRMLNHGEGVLVAVSGGPDSVALLHILHRLAPEFGVRLNVAHLNHCLRGEEAEEDARFVQGLGESLGLDVTVGKVNLQEVSRRGSLQAAARAARYRFLEEVALRKGASRIAVGHHLDDQAETVLMRFLRGAGADGLAGMAPERRISAGGAVILIRPLLEVTRRQLQTYLERHKLPFRRDSSNRNPDYLRNNVRMELIPLLEGRYNRRLSAHLAGLARQMRWDAQHLQAEAAAALTDLSEPGGREPGLAVTLDRRRAADLPPAVLTRVLRQAHERLAQGGAALDQSHIEAVLHLVGIGEGSASLDLPGGVVARRAYDKLILAVRGAVVLPPEVPLAVPGRARLPGSDLAVVAELLPAASDQTRLAAPDRAVFDYDLLRPSGGPLRVRTRRPGDRLQPQGLSSGSRKVQDLLVDAKISRFKRDLVPLVVAGPDVLWVAGVRQSRLYPVTDQTRLVLALGLEPDGGAEA